MEFDVLGPLRIHATTGVVTPAGRMQQVLLGVLLARANAPVSVDVLTDAMWDGRPDSRAPQRLQVHVHKLRRALDDPERLSYGAGSYRLAAGPGELDVARFEELVGQADATSETPARADRLRAALELWKGTPYGGLDVPLLADEARRLAERRLATLARLYEAELANGRHALVLSALSELVRDNPVHERFAALLMTALHQDGNRTAALEVYRTTRARFIEELGLEPSAELRDLERRIRDNDPLTADPAPAQLPLAVRDLVGRDVALSELDGCVGSVPVCLVVGTAGVGKTALAVEWAQRARARFPDGQLFVDLRGYGPGQPVSSHEALGGFLRALGVANAAVPADPAERAARFRSMVAGRRLLLVLDNASSAAHVRPLLPGGTTCAVVVTSRDSLAGLVAKEGARRIVLRRLDRADSVRLLSDLAGTSRDEPAVQSIVDRCARLPLALRLAAEAVRTHDQWWVADDLDLLDGGGDPESDLRTVFSWSYRGLPAPAARMFRLLGVHPGPSVHRDVLLTVTGGPPHGITTLLRAHLVEEVAGGRLAMHDLLRAYAAECADAEEDPTTRRRLYRWYLVHALAARRRLEPGASPIPGEEPGDPGPADPLAWFTAEHATLVATVRDAAEHGEHAVAWRVAAALLNYFTLTKHWDEWIDTFRTGLSSATAAGEPAGEAVMLNGLGVAHDDLCRFDEAIDFHRAAAPRFAAAGEDRLAAWNLNNLGVALERAGRLAESVVEHHAALALFRAAGDRAGEALSLNNLGDTQRQLGDHDHAAEHLRLALDLHGDGDPAGRFTHGTLGDLHRDLGDPGRARVHYTTALAVSRSHGDRVQSATLLVRLAGLPGTTDAAGHLRRALAELTGIGESGLATEIRALLASAK